MSKSTYILTKRKSILFYLNKNLEKYAKFIFPAIIT